MLVWIYAVSFVLQLAWLILACRKHRKIWPVLICSFLSAGVAAFLTWYFDALPGFGLMPGLAYFPEFFFSLCAAAAFALLTLAAFLCMLYHKKK